MFKVRRKLAVIAGVLSAVATYAGFSAVSCRGVVNAVSDNVGGWQTCGEPIVQSMVIAIPLSLAVGAAIAAFVAMRWKGI